MTITNRIGRRVLAFLLVLASVADALLEYFPLRDIGALARTPPDDVRQPR